MPCWKWQLYVYISLGNSNCLLSFTFLAPEIQAPGALRSSLSNHFARSQLACLTT